jgi:hypothetical protein
VSQAGCVPRSIDGWRSEKKRCVERTLRAFPPLDKREVSRDFGLGAKQSFADNGVPKREFGNQIKKEVFMKTRGILRLASIFGILGIFALVAPAGAGFIDFDNLPSPGPTPLVVEGVTFTPNYGGAVLVMEPFYPDNLPLYCYTVTPNPDSNFHLVLTITFDQPVSLVKFWMDTFNSNGLGYYIDALDTNGTILDRQKNNRLSPGVQRPQVLIGNGIKRVVINVKTYSEDPLRIINFSFHRLASGVAVIPLN